MKKLLVLALVMGIASLASAGLSIDATSSTVTVSVSDLGAYASQVFYVVLDSTLSVDSYEINYNGGAAPSAITDIGNEGAFQTFINAYDPAADATSKNYLVEIIDNADPFVVPDGLLITLNVSGKGTAYLSTTDPTVFDMAEVPEPATMALLGLGALVLRRKK